MRTGRQWRRLLVSAGAILAPLLTACRPRQARPTPPASFTGTQVHTVSLTSIREYIQQLRFSSKPGWADAQRVTFDPWQLGVGDSARIEPEEGSNMVDVTGRAAGRIVARIWYAGLYRTLEFGPWWSYWWVYRDATTGAWRSVFIPDTAGYVRHEVPLVEKDTTGHRSRYGDDFVHARARFVPDTDGTWYNCGYCCQSPTKG